MNGLRRVHGRHALEVDVGVGELRADVVHVVGHAAQDGVDHRLVGVAALVLSRWSFWIHSRLMTGTTPISRSA